MTTLPQQITALVQEYTDLLDLHKQRDLVWEIRVAWRAGDEPLWRCFHDGCISEPWREGNGWSEPFLTLGATYDELARALRECINDLKERVA